MALCCLAAGFVAYGGGVLLHGQQQFCCSLMVDNMVKAVVNNGQGLRKSVSVQHHLCTLQPRL